MKDLYSNKLLQKDDILARIAQSLQLDDSRRKRMESAYQALSTLINDDEDFFKDLEIEIYPHGSVPIGTTVKPWQGEEFDLDMVLHIKRSYLNYKPEEIYNALVKKLQNDGRYKHMVEKKRRCVRLNYAGDFHLDILPGCIIIISDEKNIKVPDRQLKDWTDSNPKGYAEWFLANANKSQHALLENYYRGLINLKADIEDLPDDSFISKKPLQWAVQLLKRHRDIYFSKIPDYATSSIILTTIAGIFYNGEDSIFDTINNILAGVKREISRYRSINERLKILNPVNSREDFSEKWDEEPLLYQYFVSYIGDLYNHWQKLQQNFNDSSEVYNTLFGEDLYRAAVKQQVEKLGKYSADPIAAASSLIIKGNAYTNKQGNISSNQGSRNERHRDFGAM